MDSEFARRSCKAGVCRRINFAAGLAKERMGQEGYTLVLLRHTPGSKAARISLESSACSGLAGGL
jgi:hypothetical protein